MKKKIQGITVEIKATPHSSGFRADLEKAEKRLSLLIRRRSRGEKYLDREISLLIRDITLARKLL